MLAAVLVLLLLVLAAAQAAPVAGRCCGIEELGSVDLKDDTPDVVPLVALLIHTHLPEPRECAGDV